MVLAHNAAAMLGVPGPQGPQGESGAPGSDGITPLIPGTVHARLTISSTLAAPVSDLSNQTTLYLLPFKGNQVSLYDGAAWVNRSIPDVGISITNTGLVVNTNYSVFVYDDAGTPTLELEAWTDATTRATALTLQDGVEVKSGSPTRLWIGDIRTVDDGGVAKFSDTEALRLVMNAYNQLPRRVHLRPGYNDGGTESSYSHTSTTWQELNLGVGSRAGILSDGRSQVTVTAAAFALSASGEGIRFGIGFDQTTGADVALASPTVASVTNRIIGGLSFQKYPAAGYHTISLVGHVTGGTGSFIADTPRNGAATDPEMTFLEGVVLG